MRDQKQNPAINLSLNKEKIIRVPEQLSAKAPLHRRLLPPPRSGSIRSVYDSNGLGIDEYAGNKYPACFLSQGVLAMFELTDSAAAKLKEYLETNKISSPVRVSAMNSCSGPTIGLALDDRQENDTTAVKEGIEVVIDQDLLAELEGVKVDFINEGDQGGFSITTTKPLVRTGGGCGGSCASGCGC